LKAEIVPGEEAWVSDFDAFRRQFEPTITETSKDQNMTLKESLGFTALSLPLPFLFLGLQAGCTTRAPAASELQRLQGTWEGVLVGDKSDDKYTVTITGNSFHFHRDSKFWFATTITLPAGTDPRQLHATIRDGAPGQESSVGKVVVAIYKIEDGKLTLATSGGGGDEETPKSFEAAEDKGLTRYELRKVQPQRNNTEPPKTK
jgi:uncharacterized protein (TIGR03067 family)